MPGFVIHLAIGKEYAKKNKKINNLEEFLQGTIAPDLTSNKSLTHYGKSPAYTNLKNYLKSNTIDTDYDKGFFLHLVADYLFYNHYLDRIEKPQIYDDYDYLNKILIDTYNVELPDNIKDKVFFKDGIPQIISLNLVNKMVEEISEIDLNKITKEIQSDNNKWNTYKKLV